MRWKKCAVFLNCNYWKTGKPIPLNMNANFLELYEVLVRDINAILKKDSSEKEKMEYCFRCGIEHWNNLKEKIKRESFDSDEKEIYFFKYIKPRFTGEIEY